MPSPIPEPVETAITLKDFLPLAGVAMGAGIVMFQGIFSGWRNRLRESKQLALAFRGEIQALNNIADRRNYIGYFESLIDDMRIKEEIKTAKIAVRRENFNVFKTGVKNIGTLKNPIPEMIAQYYIYSNAILEDLQHSLEGYWDNSSVEKLTSHYKNLVALMKENRDLGHRIISKIDEKYS